MLGNKSNWQELKIFLTKQFLIYKKITKKNDFTKGEGLDVGLQK